MYYHFVFCSLQCELLDLNVMLSFPRLYRCSKKVKFSKPLPRVGIVWFKCECSLYFDEKMIVTFACLGLSKTCDYIDHPRLRSWLQHLGLRGKPLDLFRSYILDRKQVVPKSDVIKYCKRGVPQGSILGPILFIISVNLPVSWSKMPVFFFFSRIPTIR